MFLKKCQGREVLGQNCRIIVAFHVFVCLLATLNLIDISAALQLVALKLHLHDKTTSILPSIHVLPGL